MVDAIRSEGIAARARMAALKAFGGRLRRLRESAGLIQERLADQLGVATQTVRNWEVGRTEPSFEHKQQIAELYEIPLVELMGRNDEAPLDDTELSAFFRDDWDRLIVEEQEFVRVAVEMAKKSKSIREDHAPYTANGVGPTE